MPTHVPLARALLGVLASSVVLAGCSDATRTTTSTATVTAPGGSSVAPGGPAGGGAGVTATTSTTVVRSTVAPTTPTTEPTDRGGAGNPTSTQASQGQGGARLLLVLDSSGSMAAKDDAGRTRMDGAKEALRTVIDDLPDDAQVGLRVYGSRVKVSGKAAPGSPACSDTRLVVPVGTVDRRALKDAVDAFRPHGDTPIGYSLEQVVHDLGDSGERAVVLVSDGEESCSADPCAVARSLAGSGVQMHVHTVGLEVDRAAKDQLQCVADATGGTYHDATSRDLGETIAEAVSTARAPRTERWRPSWGGGGDANPGALGATMLIVLLLWLLTRSGKKA